MRKLLVAISVLILPLSATVIAQRPATSSPPKPKVVATPTPQPKRSMMNRIFGRRDKATPTPAPVIKAPTTPAPKTTKARTKPRPPQPKPEPAEKPAPAETKPAPAKPQTEPPAPPKTDPAPGTAPAPEPKPATEDKTASTKKPGKKPATTVKVDTTGMDDGAKFRVAKAAAQEDAAIKELQVKAESAITEPEAHAASVAYNRALFRKVREIEPSIDGYVDKLEDAMMKRLNSEKKRE